METATPTPTPSPTKGRRWTGRVISALVVLFLLFDSLSHIVRFDPYVEWIVQLGYPERLGVVIGVVLLTCTAIYVIPRTSMLGAILLTGYLGGATATHVRLEEPRFLFALVFGVLVWAGLYLRDDTLRTLIPLRRET